MEQLETLKSRLGAGIFIFLAIPHRSDIPILFMYVECLFPLLFRTYVLSEC